MSNHNLTKAGITKDTKMRIRAFPMPSNKEAVAKYRQKINADPIAREQLLAKRRENYKKRKEAALGKNPDHLPIRSLPDPEATKRRQQWRENQRRHRAAATRAKDLHDCTPDSILQSSPSTQSPTLQPILSTPQEERKKRKRFQFLKKKNVALRKEIVLLKKQLARVKYRHRLARKCLDRERKKRHTTKGIREKIVSQQRRQRVSRRERVSAFLSRDENSRQLPGKKDTITRNKVKLQRRVLSHTLKELHSSFNAEVAKEDRISYRQFLRLRPFHITEPYLRKRHSV